MTDPPPKDTGASVRRRLLELSRERGEDFQLLLTRYANERLLFRLSVSPYACQFVLKGAALFTLWSGAPHRMTRDLDLLGYGDLEGEHIRRVFDSLLTMTVPDDGVRFNPSTVAVVPIREDQAYGGLRVELTANVTTARVRLQVDIGFGDVIIPAPSMVEFPSLLEFPAPRMLAYPRETVIAEKIEAMVRFGIANSRMKDFYDIAVLAKDFDFDGALLAHAIQATFERRKTMLPTVVPVALTTEFAEDPTKRLQWSGFVRKAGLKEAPGLAETISIVRAFVEDPLIAAATGNFSPLNWRAGKSWS